MGRRGWHIVLGVIALAAQSGCQGPLRHSPFTAKSADMPRGGAKDLPPSETARICATTAESLYKACQDREAIALFERARSLDSKQIRVCRRLAVLYMRQGDTRKAEEEFATAVQMFPRDAGLHNDLGYACYCRGRFADAERHLRKAIDMEPDNKRAWTNLGLTLGQQQRYEESLAAFKQVVGEAQAHANIGFLQLAQGQRDQAKTSYRKALDLEPDLAICHRALEKLEANPMVPAAPRDLARKQKIDTHLAGKARPFTMVPGTEEPAEHPLPTEDKKPMAEPTVAPQESISYRSPERIPLSSPTSSYSPKLPPVRVDPPPVAHENKPDVVKPTAKGAAPPVVHESKPEVLKPQVCADPPPVVRESKPDVVKPPVCVDPRPVAHESKPEMVKPPACIDALPVVHENKPEVIKPAVDGGVSLAGFREARRASEGKRSILGSALPPAPAAKAVEVAAPASSSMPAPTPTIEPARVAPPMLQRIPTASRAPVWTPPPQLTPSTLNDSGPPAFSKSPVRTNSGRSTVAGVSSGIPDSASRASNAHVYRYNGNAAQKPGSAAPTVQPVPGMMIIPDE